MQSDKQLTKHVRASYHTMYRSPGHRAAAKEAAVLIELALPHFRKLLDLPNNLEVRLAGIKGRAHGRYHVAEKMVEIDTIIIGRRMSLLEVLAHELVHAEQYHQKRLQNTLSSNGWIHLWNGERDSNKGSTYAAYRKQPWEIEAFGRQQQLAAAVAEMIAE
jgi:hypothetical protein